jgi:alkylhydroperoxidase family enzyme
VTSRSRRRRYVRRAIGETEQRLYALPAWRETPYFTERERAALAFTGSVTERERAALAFTESVTLLADGHVPQSDYDAVAERFKPDEIAALVSLIVAINAWNAISVASRAWEPGSYQP